MSEQHAPETRPTPPATGHTEVDGALAGLAGLSGMPVAEQLERLSAAHEVLARVLDTSREQVDSPMPGTRPQR